MKKPILILAFTLILSGMVFAFTNDTLLLRMSIPSNTPLFTMVGGETTSYGTTAAPIENPGIITSEKNIHNENITIYLKLTQSARTIPSRAGFSLDISVLASELTLTGNENTKSDIPSISDVQTGTGTGDFTSTRIVEGAEDGEVIFRVAYPSGNPVPTDTLVGKITYAWVQDDTLPAGEYTATITMTYNSQ
ncbi:MAG: hypothetical protein J5768_02670 [Spirochaetales bacterium]|nr:hypothetical protein [Spirochaetales bacterium]